MRDFSLGEVQNGEGYYGLKPYNVRKENTYFNHLGCKIKNYYCAERLKTSKKASLLK